MYLYIFAYDNLFDNDCIYIYIYNVIFIYIYIYIYIYLFIYIICKDLARIVMIDLIFKIKPFDKLSSRSWTAISMQYDTLLLLSLLLLKS